MTKIDTTTAEFDFASLTRGYAAVAVGNAVYYVRKTSQTEAHAIISEPDGWWEFSFFSRNSALRTAEGLADAH